MIRLPYVSLMLSQRRRWWTNIKPTPGKRPVFERMLPVNCYDYCQSSKLGAVFIRDCHKQLYFFNTAVTSITQT